MNAKQTIPVIAKIAPPLLIGVAVVLALKWLFSDDNTENKPETASADAEAERRRKEAETPPKTTVFRQIPAEIPAKPAIVPIHSAPAPVFPPAVAPVPAIIPPFSVSPVSKVSAPVPAPPKIAPQVPLPAAKKIITREDMANIFQHGSRGLTRPAAVAALKGLGFGKTAAYDTLLEDGRFSVWLRFAPDGIITWTE